jgi:hypothetical protein
MSLLALYPREWRDRYEEELVWLLSERPASLEDRIDLVRGAVDAQLHRRNSGPERVPDRVGWAPLAGGMVFLLALVLNANGPLQFDEHGSYRDGSAALPFLLAALVLLSVGLFRVVDRLPTAARMARFAGWTAIISGPFWGLGPWLLPVGVIFLLATFVLALGAWRAGLWPTWAFALVALSALVPAATMLFAVTQPWYAMRETPILALLVYIPIGILWPLVGGLVLRGSVGDTTARS